MTAYKELLKRKEMAEFKADVAGKNLRKRVGFVKDNLHEIIMTNVTETIAPPGSALDKAKKLITTGKGLLAEGKRKALGLVNKLLNPGRPITNISYKPYGSLEEGPKVKLVEPPNPITPKERDFARMVFDIASPILLTTVMNTVKNRIFRWNRKKSNKRRSKKA